ncbi:MAG: tRNA (guanine(46)-N(7))-methyltransferase TrmB [Candidatus Cloacimonetes bacterium]|nr:tRNA (guanine(46)-N(7))-methyltransferase TrmB [Candidatus Cloacimonadota bacterium]
MARRYTDELTQRDRFFFWEPPAEGPLDLSAPFGNDHPIHIEIGCGRGEFIAAKALQLPHVNFVGFEGKGKRLSAIMAKLDTERHANVRITRIFLDEKTVKRMPPASVECIYILHPDPWPKRRHHGRRLIQRPILDVLAWLLAPGGEVIVSTDHREYAEWIQREFAAHEAYEPLPVAPEPKNRIVTYFENKKRQEGFEPTHMHYKKGRCPDPRQTFCKKFGSKTFGGC